MKAKFNSPGPMILCVLPSALTLAYHWDKNELTSMQTTLRLNLTSRSTTAFPLPLGSPIPPLQVLPRCTWPNQVFLPLPTSGIVTSTGCFSFSSWMKLRQPCSGLGMSMARRAWTIAGCTWSLFVMSRKWACSVTWSTRGLLQL